MGLLGLFQHSILRGSFARFPQNRSSKTRLHKKREQHLICAKYDDLCALPHSSLPAWISDDYGTFARLFHALRHILLTHRAVAGTIGALESLRLHGLGARAQ
jgi:hypothetical protein